MGRLRVKHAAFVCMVEHLGLHRPIAAASRIVDGRNAKGRLAA
jgi:hypothetical protein